MTQSLHSMTGFGRYEEPWEGRTLSIEIRGVNHRYTDVRVRLPNGWGQMEQVIRTLVQEQVGRGRVEVNIRWGSEGYQVVTPRLDHDVVQRYLAIYQELSDMLGQNAPTPDINQLLHMPGIIITDTPEVALDQLEKPLLRIAQQALTPFVEMRSQEGQNLKGVLGEQLETLERHLQQLERRIPEVPKEHHNRLKERLDKWELPKEVDPARLEQELAFQAERCDISEEVARVQSHIQQFQTLLQQGGVIGRRLDFLCQELHREGNTMGAKSQDRQVSQTLIALKATIDKLREQVQNIE